MDEKDEGQEAQEAQIQPWAQEEPGAREEGGALSLDDEGRLEGTIHISEDVIVELARKTIQGIANIQTANTRIGAKFGIGRKGDGIRVSVENGKTPSISVDAYVLVRYGQRIPDLAWDVQEKVKANLERYTGYAVKAVNINVQGIYIDDPSALDATDEDGAEAAPDVDAAPGEASEKTED